MGKDEKLIAEVIGCAGNLIHNVTGLVGVYRSPKPDDIEYTDRAAERVMRWIIHNRKKRTPITLRQMNAKAAQFMAEEQQEVPMYCSDVTTIHTRKGYRCIWCWEHMPKGSEVKRWACFDGGSASTVRMHGECYDAMLRWYEHWDDELPTPGTYPRGCCCEDRECKDCKEYVNSNP